MSIQWTVIAGYLYCEVAIVIIMISPLIKPRIWYQFFRSRIFLMIKKHAAAYFYVLLGVLSLFLIDAMREMKKYSNTEPGGHINLSSEMKGNVKLFRAQRNFYITGFAIFLAFIIRRLFSMLLIQDDLTKKADMVLKLAGDSVKRARHTTWEASQNLLNNPLAQEYKRRMEEAEILLVENRGRCIKLEEELAKWKTKPIEAGDAKGEGGVECEAK